MTSGLRWTLALALALALTGCEERPELREQAMRDRQVDRERDARTGPMDEVKKDVELARQAASGKLPRAADPKDQNIRVAIRYVDQGEYERLRVSARVAVRGGDVGVRAGGEGFRRNGFHVGLLGSNVAAHIGGASRSGRHTQTTQQFVVTLNGHAAQIQMGRVTPVSHLRYYGRRGVVYDVDLVETGAVLAVEPTIIDPAAETISVKVWPELSALRAHGEVELTRVETMVVIRNGMTIAIGALSGGGSSLARGLLSSRSASSASSRVILLTVSY